MHVVLVGPEFEENLSLRYLAAVLQQARHTVSLARFDSPEYTDGVIQQVLREQPGLVGLSMVFQVRAREFCDLARALRKAGYTGHITAGGHFATFACEPLLLDVPEIDSIVRQEGEETLVELVSALERGLPSEKLSEIAGIVARDELGAVRVAPPRHQGKNLDSLPFPVRSVSPELHLGVPTSYLVGSRGCYADCEYCCIFAWYEAAVGKRYRMRTVANIADEMEKLYHERGIRFFVFHDDNFFLPTAAGNRKRFEALRKEIQSRHLDGIGLMLKLRPNDCDRENLLILKDIGLFRAFVGIENASPRQMKSLGRETTVEEVETCLSMLRELDIYCTYNILLFDPYTRLEDIETNLQFLRRNLFYPFNWCKVEPYAGTELEKRYAREERLRGDYFGYDYRMDDERATRLYEILLPAFYYRNFDYYGLANLNIGLGYHRQLLKQFYPGKCTSALDAQVQTLIEAINASALDLIERACNYIRTVELNRNEEIELFAQELKRDSFRMQHRFSDQVETALRAIEQAAGVRPQEAGSVPVAFTPLQIAREPKPPTPPVKLRSLRVNAGFWQKFWPRPTQATAQSGTSRHAWNRDMSSEPAVMRRALLGALGTGTLLALAGCHRPVKPQQGPSSGPSAAVIAPQGVLRVASGSPSTVAATEPMTLEAILIPDDAEVIGTPRVTCHDGKIKNVTLDHGNRTVRILYQPGGGSRQLDPNTSVTVAWTVRGPDTDTVILARASIHVNEDGSYAFGYETPRPTIAEMAAPPIRQGPNPNGGNQ